MTSLSETYGGTGRSEVDPRRLLLGVGLFLGGTLFLVAGILAAAEVLVPSGYSAGAARRLGGILGGLGVPLVTLGVMTVLPAGRRTRAAAVVGAATMALGVALFSQAYPTHWVGGPRPDLVDLTLPTAGVYFLGAAATMWSVFVGVANFKTRNDPGGTVTMEVTHKGETKVIEVDRDSLGGLGGVGLVGTTPGGDVQTQTNQSAGDGATRRRSPRAGAGVSDGGDATPTLSSPLDDAGGAGGAGGANGTNDADILTPSSPATPQSPRTRAPPGDAYCGSCARFDYVRTDEGMQPYCTHYEEVMDDMDACDQWTKR